MNKPTTLLLATFAGTLALSVGCKAPPLQSGTGGGSGGEYVYLPSTSTGFVQDPTSGVIGAWFAYGDGVGANAGVGDAGTDNTDSDCVQKGGFPPSDCTQITSPTPGMPFAPTDPVTSKQCTTGIAAQVMNKGSAPDYADLWGGGIGLDFNNPGGDAGVAQPLDLSAYAGIAFDFSADVLPNKSMRVNFPFVGEHGTDSPYWGGATMAYSGLTGTTAAPQHLEVRWADVGGPLYLTLQTPPVDVMQFPFNPAMVSAIQFQVFTNAQAATPYSFCVANLALIGK